MSQDHDLSLIKRRYSEVFGAALAPAFGTWLHAGTTAAPGAALALCYRVNLPVPADLARTVAAPMRARIRPRSSPSVPSWARSPTPGSPPIRAARPVWPRLARRCAARLPAAAWRSRTSIRRVLRPGGQLIGRGQFRPCQPAAVSGNPQVPRLGQRSSATRSGSPACASTRRSGQPA